MARSEIAKRPTSYCPQALTPERYWCARGGQPAAPRDCTYCLQVREVFFAGEPYWWASCGDWIPRPYYWARELEQIRILLMDWRLLLRTRPIDGHGSYEGSTKWFFFLLLYIWDASDASLAASRTGTRRGRPSDQSSNPKLVISESPNLRVISNSKPTAKPCAASLLCSWAKFISSVTHFHRMPAYGSALSTPCRAQRCHQVQGHIDPEPIRSPSSSQQRAAVGFWRSEGAQSWSRVAEFCFSTGWFDSFLQQITIYWKILATMFNFLKILAIFWYWFQNSLHRFCCFVLLFCWVLLFSCWIVLFCCWMFAACLLAFVVHLLIFVVLFAEILVS